MNNPEIDRDKMSNVPIANLIAKARRNLSNVIDNPVHSIDLDLYGDILDALKRAQRALEADERYINRIEPKVAVFEYVTEPTDLIVRVRLAQSLLANSGYEVAADSLHAVAKALESVTEPTKPPVHNHGPAEDRGLDCNESIVGGFLQGACMRVTEQTDPFSQSPHMAAKYWGQLVKARKRIAELEAEAAPTEPELEYGLIGHVDDEIPVFESRKFAENELANQKARLQRQADPDPPPVMFQRVKRGSWVEVSS